MATTATNVATPFIATLAVALLLGVVPGASASLATQSAVIPSHAPGVTATVGVGASPTGAYYDAANRFVYVLNCGSNNVSAINTSTNTIAASIAVGSCPQFAALVPSSNELYTSNVNSGNVTVINCTSNRVVGNISVGYAPEWIAYDPTSNRVFVDVGGTGQVVAIQASNQTIAARITVGKASHGLVYDARSNELFATNQGSDSVSVINGSSDSLVKTIGHAKAPWAISYDPINGFVYASYAYPGGSQLGNVTIINGTSNSRIGWVNTGSGFDWSVAGGTNGNVYVSSQQASSITVVGAKSSRIVTTISLKNAGPNTMVYDPHEKWMFVFDSASNQTSVVSTKTYSVLYTLSVGNGPSQGVYDPSNHCVYILNSLSANVTVVKD